MTLCDTISHRRIVLATDLGNPPVVRYLAGGSVRLGWSPG